MREIGDSGFNDQSGEEWHLPPGLDPDLLDAGETEEVETTEAPALETGAPVADVYYAPETEPDATPLVAEEMAIPPEYLQVSEPSSGVANRETNIEKSDAEVVDGEFVISLEEAMSPAQQQKLRQVCQGAFILTEQQPDIGHRDREALRADTIDFATVRILIERGERGLAPAQSRKPLQAPCPDASLSERARHINRTSRYGALLKQPPMPGEEEPNYDGMGFIQKLREMRWRRGQEKVRPRLFVPGTRHEDMLRNAKLLEKGNVEDASAAMLKYRAQKELSFQRLGGGVAVEMLEIFGGTITSDGIINIDNDTILSWPQDVRSQALTTLNSILLGNATSLVPKNPLEHRVAQQLFERILAFEHAKDDPAIIQRTKEIQERSARKARLPKPESTAMIVAGREVSSPGILPVLAATLGPNYSDIVVAGMQYDRDTERVLREAFHPGIRGTGAIVDFGIEADVVISHGSPHLPVEAFMDHIRPNGGIGILPDTPEFAEYNQEVIKRLKDKYAYPRGEYTLHRPEDSGYLNTEGLTTWEGRPVVEVDGHGTIVIVHNAPLRKRRT